jgi:hypothetical protein
MLLSDRCRYLLHYVLTYGPHGSIMIAAGLSFGFFLVMLVGIGESEFFRQLFFFSLWKHTDDLVCLTARIYLGMHSLTDVIAGICFGIIILAFWLVVHDHVDAFIVSGKKGIFIHLVLSSCQSLCHIRCDIES